MSGTVLVTSRSFSSGSIDVEGRLADAGLSVMRGDTGHSLPELSPVLREADAWIAGTSTITAEMMDTAPHLKIIARYGVGVDSVDLTAARARDIIVTNTPGANSDSVADLATALLMVSLRQVVAGNAAVRRGDWTAMRGRELSALTVGVGGFGHIGRRFAGTMRALGARVIVYDPFITDELAEHMGVERVGGFGALADCDAVSLHAPGGQRLVDREWLVHARGTALVNTARADLVDEAAIAQALRDGHLSSYAADTVSSEGGRGDTNPLLACDISHQVVVTPHLGAQTVQAIDRMGEGAVRNVVAVLAGEPAPNAMRP